MIRWTSFRYNCWFTSVGMWCGLVQRERGSGRWSTEVHGEPGPTFRRRVDAKRYVEREASKTSEPGECPF